uniref:calcium-binding protein n=1 Tax=Mesorhizobium amorphae TaxID=71433 RepID=UPI00391F7B9B
MNDGGLAVAFPAFASNYTVSGIQIQFRNPDGTIRASHQVNQGSAGSLGGNVELATLDTGETVVTWVDGSGIKARLYDATGAALGNEVTIAPVGATQSIVEVASLAGGRVALVWGDGPGGLAPTKLYGAIMDHTGTVVVPAFTIDGDRGQAYSWGDNPSVTELSNGNIVAAWSSSDSSGWYITTRLFNSSGVPLGEEHRAIGGNGEGPSVAALPSGGYILVWQTSYRIFDQNGAPIGDEFQFTDLRGTGGLFLYGETDVKVLTDGRVVITWTGAGDIYAQIVDPRTQGITLNGTAADDQLVGSEYADMLVGEAGHDQLFGMSGNDNIYGGAGDDFLYGGVGDDNLDGGAGAD